MGAVSRGFLAVLRCVWPFSRVSGVCDSLAHWVWFAGSGVAGGVVSAGVYPGAGKPPRVLTVSVLQRMRRNPYYCGIVTYVGVEYPGTHESLVEPALWQRVQDVLTARRNTSTRDVHTHYLKGLLRCGECGSSMMYDRTRNNRGTLYFYFVCLGRHSGRTTCMLKAQQVHLI